MATDPELYARLRADRELVPNAVEETLRLYPPVRVLLRDVMQEKDTHGKTVCPHDKIAFGLECANRDETKFDDPHEFRLDREKPRNHLAFGGGPHVCPGASLARMEANIAANVVLDKVESMSIHGPDEYVNGPLWWARGPASLTVDVVWADEPALTGGAE
jgi:cytochrome P450